MTGGGYQVLATGPYSAGDIHAQCVTRQRPSSAALDAIIETEWRHRTEQAGRNGQELFDGRLWRLLDHSMTSSSDPRHKLHLTLGPGRYRDFVGTNLYHSDLLSNTPWNQFGNPVGTSALVITRDQRIVLGLRSGKVAFHAGHLHAFGGILEQRDCGPDSTVDVFASIRRELREELALTDANLQDLRCLALVKDHEIHQPELLFAVRVPCTSAELSTAWEQADSRAEHQQLVDLEATATGVRQLLDQAPPISGVAVAALEILARSLPQD